MKTRSLEYLAQLQKGLEESYQLKIDLDVRDFVISQSEFPELGRLHVEVDPRNDLDVALILDRDILSAFEGEKRKDEGTIKRAYSVVFEELSHFVYLCFNHNRGRNITRLEMEMQSEVDRLLLAFHGPVRPAVEIQQSLWKEFQEQEYGNEKYEESRKAALHFVRNLSKESPEAWTEKEIQKLLQFFHSDLGEKLHLARKS